MSKKQMAFTMPPQEIQKRLEKLPYWQWNQERDCIERLWRASSFAIVLQSIVEIGEVAQKLNHHPEWWNSYSQLNIRLRTNDCNGISTLDFDMAEVIEAIIQKHH